MQVQRN